MHLDKILLTTTEQKLDQQGLQHTDCYHDTHNKKG